jgi:hypothetical protein
MHDKFIVFVLKHNLDDDEIRLLWSRKNHINNVFSM